MTWGQVSSLTSSLLVGLPEQTSHPWNCCFALWTWMGTLITWRFWLLNPPSTLLCPCWQWYLAVKSSDWRSSALSFLKGCCSISMSYPSGIPQHRNALLNPSSSVFRAWCLKQVTHETLLNFPQFTLPNTSTEDLERTPEMVCKSAQASED